MSSSDYRAFMLRMRRVGDGIRPKWAYMLQDVSTHAQHTFRSLGALMLFIEQQTESQDEQDLTVKMKDNPDRGK